MLTWLSMRDFDWRSFGGWVVNIVNIGLLITCVLGPILITRFLRARISKFRRASFKDKYGDIIENLSFRRRSAPNLVSIFCYQRLMLVLLIIFASNYGYAQIQLQCFTNQFFVIAVGTFTPFRTAVYRRMEYMNQVSIMICTYHYFCMTDFVPDPETRYTVGTWLIIASCLNIVINLAVLVCTTSLSLFRKLRLNCKRKVLIIKANRKRKERKEARDKLL